MYHADHAPPHIHAEYQGNEALIAIATGEVSAGSLPSRARKLVHDWCLEHQSELMDNWGKAVALEPLERIPGADND